MGDGSLSQDEIDALLQGADEMISTTGQASSSDLGHAGGSVLSPHEQSSIRDALSSSLSIVVPTLSGYLGGKNLSIFNPFIEVKTQDGLRADFPAKYVQVAIDYNGAINGKNLVIYNLADAIAISSLMMGGERLPPELDDAHQSTIQEFTNQLLSSMATQFGNNLGGGINTTAAILSMVNNAYDLRLPSGQNLVKVSYNLSIPGIINSKLYHIMDLTLASGLSSTSGSSVQQAVHPQTYQSTVGQVGISPVKFPPLDEGITQGVGGNISLLLDVPMTLTVELGRTTQMVQEILGLGEGSIIELDKLAGEPVDLLVNGKLIAKGEVVVIDENFGVRVTDIVSPADRLGGIQ